MKIDFDLLDKMISAGASARMIVDVLKEKSGECANAKASAAFLQFRAVYPRRDGANPWKPAEKKFYALVKSGVDPALIIAGARQLSADEYARGKIGTQFIPQAVTWLNQQRYSDASPSETVSETSTRYYAKFGSAQLDAWHAHSMSVRGKGLPRDRAGGWYVPSEWPPAQEVAA